ncbi:MAG: PLATZ transcription factor-domain-containing protein [Monoraphidium minutum]|nr:MAG: PLATZ transcription factor-domain-containing protein [Monoraphidium minutum]
MAAGRAPIVATEAQAAAIHGPRVGASDPVDDATRAADLTAMALAAAVEHHASAAQQHAALLRRQLAAAVGLPCPSAASRSNSPYMGPASAPAAAAALPSDGLRLPAGPASCAALPLPLFKAGAHACAAPVTPLTAPRLSATGSGCHSHASSLAAADPHCAAALLADAASAPRPSPLAPTPAALEQQQQQHAAAAAVAAAAAAAGTVAAAKAAAALSPMDSDAEADVDADDDGRAWQHALVTCPWLFKPCPGCCKSHTGREVLMTYFDASQPAVRGMCSYCPGRAARAAAAPGGLLQIRRSTYHEVVKAADLGRMADVTGIQHYVINGAKVVFLRPRPQPRPPKGVAAPSRCAVDGRQLMDGAARFCSLQCKLEGEDPCYAARHALAAARAEVDAAALAADLAATAAAAPAGAAAGAAPADAGAGASDQAGPAGGTKRAAGLMRFDGDDSGDDDDNADQAGGRGRGLTEDGGVAGSGGAPRWGGRGKRQRAASVGVALAAAGARGSAGGGHSHGHHAAPGGAAPATPASSHDSGRSSTCRWHAKRRKGEPVRAPLQ